MSNSIELVEKLLTDFVADEDCKTSYETLDEDLLDLQEEVYEILVKEEFKDVKLDPNNDDDEETLINIYLDIGFATDGVSKKWKPKKIKQVAVEAVEKGREAIKKYAIKHPE